jgi:hypothetical protein
MGEVYVPEPGDTGWRIGASVFAAGLRTMLLRHPWVIGQLGLRPNLGPNALRMGDRMVALLTAAGFTGVELAHASSTLISHAIGAATTFAAFTTSSRDAGVPMSEIAERLEPYLEMIAADHPAYDKWRREIGPALSDPERMAEESFMFGLDRVLDGLERWLARGTDD